MHPNPHEAANLEPLLINTVGSWGSRPEADLAIFKSAFSTALPGDGLAHPAADTLSSTRVNDLAVRCVDAGEAPSTITVGGTCAHCTRGTMRNVLLTLATAVLLMMTLAGTASAHPHDRAANGFVGPTGTPVEASGGQAGVAHNGIQCAVGANPHLGDLGLDCPAD